MKYGIRDICNVVFKAKNDMTIGTASFVKGQPVLYIDTAKTSTTEGAATTVYATGGRGNTRLIAWEGERTLTFNVEDALLSPISFAMLSGAGVLKGASDSTQLVHVHLTAQAYTNYDATQKGYIDLQDACLSGDIICPTAPIFVAYTENDGSLTGTLIEGFAVGTTASATLNLKANQYLVKADAASTFGGSPTFVDFYVERYSKKVNEIQIDGNHFGGYFYVEAQTLWRDTDGADHAAEMTFPNVKIQSNFTFNNAATGDPSTFTFTMDAFPGYTWFNKTRKVLLAMQIMDDIENAGAGMKGVFDHNVDEVIDSASGPSDFFDDSVQPTG